MVTAKGHDNSMIVVTTQLRLGQRKQIKARQGKKPINARQDKDQLRQSKAR